MNFVLLLYVHSRGWDQETHGSFGQTRISCWRPLDCPAIGFCPSLHESVLGYSSCRQSDQHNGFKAASLDHRIFDLKWNFEKTYTLICVFQATNGIQQQCISCLRILDH